LDKELIGKEFESNNYGKYKVIGFDRKDEYYQEYYRIKFLKTGYETVSQKSSVQRGTVRDNTDLLIGKVIESNNYGKFKVLELDHRDKRSHKFYRIKFMKTGTERVMSYGTIVVGSVLDYNLPTTGGVGYLGEKFEECVGRVENVWRHIIARCYREEDDNYPYYGGRGVTVCERWHNCSNFLEDLPKIEGYDEKLFKEAKIELDKDYKQQDIPFHEKVYSPETCIFLSKEKNNNVKKINQNDFKAISPEGEVYYGWDQTAFAREHNLTPTCVNKVLKGKRNHHKGWTFEFIEKDERGD